MSSVAYASPVGLVDRVAQLLSRVDYRVAESEAEREAIYRLRYAAYLKDGSISANFSKKLHDAYDEADNVWIFGIYVDGRLASSIRMHVASPENPTSPGASVFPDFFEPELKAGKIILDPTRFVTDDGLSRLHPALSYVTVRLVWLAADYFNTDHALATVRAEHQAFYRRVFNLRLVCPPRPYPSLNKPISLMTAHFPAVADYVHRRYPFFRSSYFERRMLFERPTANAREIARRRQEGLPLLTANDAGMQPT